MFLDKEFWGYNLNQSDDRYKRKGGLEGSRRRRYFNACNFCDPGWIVGDASEDFIVPIGRTFVAMEQNTNKLVVADQGVSIKYL